MRMIATTFVILVCTSVLGHAQADPYRWCAQYGGKNGASVVSCTEIKRTR